MMGGVKENLWHTEWLKEQIIIICAACVCGFYFHLRGENEKLMKRRIDKEAGLIWMLSDLKSSSSLFSIFRAHWFLLLCHLIEGVNFCFKALSDEICFCDIDIDMWYVALAIMWRHSDASKGTFPWLSFLSFSSCACSSLCLHPVNLSCQLFFSFFLFFALLSFNKST